MQFNEYQRKARKTAIYAGKGDNIFYAALGLGEAGEVQNTVKKIMRDDNGVLTKVRKQLICYELGDLLWYIAAMCSEMKVNMDKIAEMNIKKLYDRMKRGQIKGSGDKR